MPKSIQQRPWVVYAYMSAIIISAKTLSTREQGSDGAISQLAILQVERVLVCQKLRCQRTPKKPISAVCK